MGSDEHREDPQHEALQRLRDAALEAELATGRREETVEQARAHVLVRLGRISLGFLVVGLGIAAIPLPGPGWLILAAGFAILAKDFVWAERTLQIVRRRLPQDANGRIPPRTWVTLGALTTMSVGASLWWSLAR